MWAGCAGVLNEQGIPWQMAELGRVDLGGGGTVAMYLAAYGMDIIDFGPAILGMHSPFELASKADLYAHGQSLWRFSDALTTRAGSGTSSAAAFFSSPQARVRPRPRPRACHRTAARCFAPSPRTAVSCGRYSIKQPFPCVPALSGGTPKTVRHTDSRAMPLSWHRTTIPASLL